MAEKLINDVVTIDHCSVLGLKNQMKSQFLVKQGLIKCVSVLTKDL